MKTKFISTLGLVAAVGLLLGGFGQVHAQPVDLSILTNHAALVNWAFKQVSGITANLSCPVQSDDQRNLHVYQYDDPVKTLDHIKDVVSRDPWWVHVINVTNYFTLDVMLYKTNNINVARWDPSTWLFQGVSRALPEKNIYGNWELPRSATTIGLTLMDKLLIKVPGIIDARLITRDNNGDLFTISFEVEKDAMWFPTAQVGSGTLVITYYVYNSSSNSYSYEQKAYDLSTGLETPLTWVFVQMLVKSSAHIVDFKNTPTISAFVWDNRGYGTVPLLQAVFTSPMTNVTFSVTAASGQYAKWFDVEEAATGKRAAFTVPPGSSTAYGGTNVFKGVYNVIPHGLSLKVFQDL